MTEIKEYWGKIRVRDECESGDGLYLDTDESMEWEEPLAEKIEDDIYSHGRYLTVTYWITDEPHPREEVQEAWIRRVLGDSSVEYRVASSEITGYLWTDEEITVGGHDLLAELANNAGKFVHLEISYSMTPPVEWA